MFGFPLCAINIGMNSKIEPHCMDIVHCTMHARCTACRVYVHKYWEFDGGIFVSWNFLNKLYKHHSNILFSCYIRKCDCRTYKTPWNLWFLVFLQSLMRFIIYSQKDCFCHELGISHYAIILHNHYREPRLL